MSLLVVLTLIGIGFGWRLVDLQLLPDESLAADLGSQVHHEQVTAPRGEILDRHGREIALSLPRPSIVANPELLQAADAVDPTDDLIAEAVDALASVLTTEPAVVRERLESDRTFVFLERQVDPEIGEAVRALELPGVYIDEEQRREHPNGDCSAISLVGRVDTDQRGISGLEEEYDDHLTGTPGEVVRQTQAGGEVRIPGGFQVVTPMEPGKDLTLTIDRNIQFEAEQLAIEAVTEAEAARGMILVGDPVTGEVLAMANVSRDEEDGPVKCTTNNLAATRVYEPGSIMKPITFASVFENDAWPELYPLDIPRRLQIDQSSFEFVDESIDKEDERVSRTPTWVLRKSSNNGTILMAYEVGADALHETLVAFGFGETTGLELGGEARGILDELDSNALELSNAAIGQGVAVTPLQMLQAYSTLAAGGLRNDPVVVVDEIDDRPPVRVVSQETADTVMQMMRQVVIDGTGRAADVAGYDVAGKTGTAWQPCAGGVGYECDGGGRVLTASFAGIVSNDDGPALSVVVVVDDPQVLASGGGAVAAPVFAEIAAYALRQLRVPPLSDDVSRGGRVRADFAVPFRDPADTDPSETAQADTDPTDAAT